MKIYTLVFGFVSGLFIGHAWARTAADQHAQEILGETATILGDAVADQDWSKVKAIQRHMRDVTTPHK